MKSLKHTSLKQAKIKAAALFAAVEDGKDPLANQQADAAADTFANLASRYLGAVGQEAAQSWRQTDRIGLNVPMWTQRLAPARE